MSLHRRTSSGARAAIALAIAAALSTFIPHAIAAPGAPTITDPQAGSVTSGLGAVTIKGTADAGSTVEVFRTVPTAGSLGTTTADASNAWSISAPLGSGTHTIHATAADGTATSLPSDAVTFDVDGTRPTVAITSPENNHLFGPSESVALEGTASDDRGLHAIKVEYWSLGSMRHQDLAACDGCDGSTSGTWVHEPSLTPGDWTAKVFAVDEAGNYSLSASVSFVATTSGVGFEVPDLGLLPDELLPPDILEPDDGSMQPGAGQPIDFGGTSEPGSTVELYEEFQGLGTIGGGAKADETGHWSISVGLPTGTYSVTARATDDEGNVSPLSELITFTVDSERPLVDVLTKDNKVFLPTEQVVLEGTVGDNLQVASVVLEYYNLDGALVLRDLAECDTCPAASASWRHEPQLPFGPERYTVNIWAFDVAGNGAHKRTITIIKTL